MKTFRSGLAVVIGATVLLTGNLSVWSQQVDLSNFDNWWNTNSYATNYGLIWTNSPDGPGLLQEDVNVTLLGGTSATNLTELCTLTVADGTALYDVYIFGDGVLFDLWTGFYAVPGAGNNGPAVVELRLWLGYDTNYDAAVSNGVPVADSGPFDNPTGGSGEPPTIPPGLVGMPAMILQSSGQGGNGGQGGAAPGGSGAGGSADSGTAGSGTTGTTGTTPSGGSGGYGPLDSSSYGSNTLWLEITGVTNAVANLIVHGTVEDMVYEILSKQALTNAQWVSDGTVVGTAGQDWTPVTVSVGTLTNALFFWARSWMDSDGSGLPDWWQLQYFGHLGVDPYADPDNDGWNNLQEYQNGTNPNSFDTPPAPQGLAVIYNSSNSVVQVGWLPSSGSVTGYTIVRYIQETGQQEQFDFSASTQGFTDNFPISDPDPAYSSPTYQIQAHYAGGDSALSTVSLFDSATSVSGTLVRGTSGETCLVIPTPLAPGTTALRLNRYYQDGFTAVRDTFELSTSLLTNGVAILPGAWVSPLGQNYWWSMQTLGTNWSLSEPSYIGSSPRIPFFDGRTQLEQNVQFLLRIPNQTDPFRFVQTNGLSKYQASPSTYVFSSLYRTHDDNYCADDASFDEFMPFEDNYLFRNFVFSESDLDSTGHLTTGPEADGLSDYDCNWNLFYWPFFNGPGSYYFEPPTNLTSIPALLGPSEARWTYYIPLTIWDAGLEGINITHAMGRYYMTNTTLNYFGLPFLSAKFAYNQSNSLQFATLLAGNSIPEVDGYVYPETATPQLQTVDYYFARPDLDPLPGQSVFSTTNSTPLLLAGFGTPCMFAGYAKQQLTNGYAGVFAYCAQYFENAFTIGTNGVVTGNPAAVVSPYGEFYPTAPGNVALVTMPDLDTGERGTGIVHVIKLQLDVNHDGVMDLSFAGPDNTSEQRPFVFWANNDYDRLEYDADDNTNYEDSVLVAGCPYTPNQDTKDNNYRDASGRRVIPTKRDLQDFTRLWLAGITTNLLTNLPSGSTITLSWGDVGSPNTNNPTIDLFAAAEANGGIGYLTNETVASLQTNIALCPYIERLGPGSSIQLNASTFSNHWAGNYFIWCGEAYGNGALTLTIADASSNVLAQTVTYIQIVDIKQMYERWTIGDAPSIVPTTNAVPAVEDLPPFTQAFQYPYDPATDANTPYILFVHGWNMTRNDKDRFAESAFKRLYWQGYQGRFGLFRWPTDNGFKGTLSQLFSDPTQKDNYDRSEYQAWQSAAGLRNKLNDLNAKYPGRVYLLAHSMGNVVAGEALRLSGSSQVVNAYVASQGAVSAHTYDTNVPTYSFSYPPFSSSADTPNIYGGWFATNNGNGAGRILNFYNTNDYALARGHWQLDQLFKPDQAVLESGVSWYYNYDGSTNDPPPWNNFYKQTSDGSTVIGFNIVTSLNNRYEVMAFAAQSYTTALGATPGVGHIAANVNITTLWPSPDPLGNNYGSHFYHSAEFRGDTPPEWNYWHLLLTSPTTGFNISTP